ncbi:MAG: hypothetical protein ACLSHW_02170 [Lachnospiraceae bacterium]
MNGRSTAPRDGASDVVCAAFVRRTGFSNNCFDNPRFYSAGNGILGQWTDAALAISTDNRHALVDGGLFDYRSGKEAAAPAAEAPKAGG